MTVGDFGTLDISAYEHTRQSPETIKRLEDVVRHWLATRPGSFSGKGACDPYFAARASFRQWSGMSTVEEAFEIALARLGFRAGCVTFRGDPFWMLVLPSSVDTALDRMAAMER